MDSAGQLATVARTDLIKSDLHGSDQSTELVRSRHFDISVHRVQSRFILGLMTSRDGIFKVGRFDSQPAKHSRGFEELIWNR